MALLESMVWFVWFFSPEFLFSFKIISYNFIVIGGFLFSALFLSRLVILLVSVHSNSLLITCEVHRYGIEGELHDERFNPGAATLSVAVPELSVLGHRDFSVRLARCLFLVKNR